MWENTLILNIAQRNTLVPKPWLWTTDLHMDQDIQLLKLQKAINTVLNIAKVTILLRDPVIIRTQMHKTISWHGVMLFFRLLIRGHLVSYRSYSTLILVKALWSQLSISPWNNTPLSMWDPNTAVLAQNQTCTGMFPWLLTWYFKAIICFPGSSSSIFPYSWPRSHVNILTRSWKVFVFSHFYYNYMVTFLSEYQLPDHIGLSKKSQWLLKFVMKWKRKQT